jgi:drug/metabolite transporter (DMT)-like permease
MSASAERRGTLLVLGAALLWSTGGVAIKAVEAGPLPVAFYRSAIAAVALFLFLRPASPRAGPGFLAAIGSYAACLTTFVVATKWTSAANAIFLQYSGVVWVMLFSPIVLKEPMRARDAVAVVVAFAGMALFFVGKLEATGRAGDLVALASGIFFAVLVLSLRKERGESSRAAVTWGNVLTALLLLPFVRGGLAVPARSALILAFLGVFQIAAAYALFVAGLRHITATQASLAGMLEPIANPVWVFLILGERPETLSIAGGLIVLGAIAWRTLATGRAVAERVAPPD